jgi:hypothetical protein
MPAASGRADRGFLILQSDSAHGCAAVPAAVAVSIDAIEARRSRQGDRGKAIEAGAAWI